MGFGSVSIATRNRLIQYRSILGLVIAKVVLGKIIRDQASKLIVAEVNMASATNVVFATALSL